MPLPFYREHFSVTYAPRGPCTWVVYIFFLLLILVCSAVVCFFTQGFWVNSVVDCGSPSVKLDPESCALKVFTVQGETKYWTCSTFFNEAYLMSPTSGGSIFTLPYLSFYIDKDGSEVDIIISVPIGNVSGNIYATDAAGGTLPASTALDGIESITFIPRIEYEATGNFHTERVSAAPSFTYDRNRGYLPDGLDNTKESFSGGPVAVHQSYAVQYAPVRGTSSSSSCKALEANGRPLDPLLSNYFSLTSNCNISSRTLLPIRVREDVGGLDVLPTWSTDGSMSTIDLGQLQAFNWFISISFPEACMPHTAQVGYSLKWAYVQFFVLAYAFQVLFWYLRGFLVTGGVVDVNAFSRRRILGQRDQ